MDKRPYLAYVLKCLSGRTIFSKKIRCNYVHLCAGVRNRGEWGGRGRGGWGKVEIFHHTKPGLVTKLFCMNRVAQEGLTLHPPDLRSLVEGVKAKTLQNDYFWLCDGKCKDRALLFLKTFINICILHNTINAVSCFVTDIITTINEQFLGARRVNSTAHDGEGAIIACIPCFILITT